MDTVRKFQNKEVPVTGTTTGERAASLLDGFKAAGPAEEIERRIAGPPRKEQA